MTAAGIARRVVGAMTAAVLLGFCAACGVNPATGRQQPMLMSAAEEARIGAAEHPKILAEFGGVYRDPKVSGYIATLGGRLAAATELPGLRFRFTVLNSPVVNAMALPGGYVYVTRGLLALARNEAEVAGVLGHEIGHVVARHAAARVSQAQLSQLGLIGLSILGGAAGLPTDTGRLAQAAAALHLRRYSREQEFEADTLGARYMRRAGFDAAAMASFLTQLRAHGRLTAKIAGRPADTVDETDIMATHPRTLDRIRRATATVARPRPGRGARLGQASYLQVIDGMTFGSDPKQGLVRGREFSHRGLGFRFEAPKGFHLTNRPAAVLAKGPGAIVVFDADGGRAKGSMTAYLSRVWARRSLNDLEAITINHMPAATGWLEVEGRRGPMVLRLVAIRAAPRRIYRFLFIASPHVMRRQRQAFRRMSYSLRRRSPEEAAALKASRIGIHRVGDGEARADLVARMGNHDHAADWFDVLNGRTANRPVRPGDLVKLLK
jgi:predicted Zn-dependent protease